MPLEKIGDVSTPCTSPEHNPPQWMVYQPGVYKWTCPVCGMAQVFTVESTTTCKSYKKGG